jgi:uncharacterized protein YggT (Ycf19 family)
MPTTFDPPVSKDDPRLPRPLTVPPRRDDGRAVAVARAMQVVTFLFGMLYTAIGFEIVLEALAARDRNGFKQFLDAITDPFLSPFRTLLPTFSLGGSELIFSYVVALVVYVLLHLGIRKIARMIVDPRPTV